MHSKRTSAAEAVHQAALNVHNTDSLPSDLRHAHVEPAVLHKGEQQSEQSVRGTQQPLMQQPMTQQPMTQQSNMQQPMTQQRTMQQPMMQQPNMQQQTMQQPMMQQTRETGRPVVFHEDSQQPTMMSSSQPRTMSTQAPMSTETMSTGRTKMMNTVDSVTRDQEAQIDAQVAEALAKSRALNAQDHARLQASIGLATASLEEQARILKAQIDEEKRRAEADVLRVQQDKLSSTATRQQMEERAILEAAAARKIELEQKAMRLQQEIEEITRRKTAEMMAEKPGNLQFIHESQDAQISAQLAGDIGHALDIKKGGRITQTTTGGEVQYRPVQVTETGSLAAQQARAFEQTMATEPIHQVAGGTLHPMKTVPAATRAYDEQSQWANQSDKYMAK